MWLYRSDPAAQRCLPNRVAWVVNTSEIFVFHARDMIRPTPACNNTSIGKIKDQFPSPATRESVPQRRLLFLLWPSLRTGNKSVLDGWIHHNLTFWRKMATMNPSIIQSLLSLSCHGMPIRVASHSSLCNQSIRLPYPHPAVPSTDPASTQQIRYRRERPSGSHRWASDRMSPEYRNQPIQSILLFSPGIRSPLSSPVRISSEHCLVRAPSINRYPTVSLLLYRTSISILALSSL